MTQPTLESRLVAIWSRDARATAWQVLQAQLSHHMKPDTPAWTRRSAVICKWRALPAGVSARAPRVEPAVR
jgi:hypothetical protein